MDPAWPCSILSKNGKYDSKCSAGARLVGHRRFLFLTKKPRSYSNHRFAARKCERKCSSLPLVTSKKQTIRTVALSIHPSVDRRVRPCLATQHLGIAGHQSSATVAAASAFVFNEDVCSTMSLLACHPCQVIVRGGLAGSPDQGFKRLGFAVGKTLRWRALRCQRR